MEDFKKHLVQKMLGQMVERRSGDGVNNSQTEVGSEDLQQLLANMPPKKFKKLVQKAQKEGDKETTSALLTNWPFRDK